MTSPGAGLSVLAYYTQRYPHSTLEQWHDRLNQGQILLDGQPPDPHEILRPGQQLAYHRPPWPEPIVPLDFQILHQDPDLWIIAKPSGLPVLPGGQFLVHTLLGQLQQRYPQETPIPIHRLGRGTSGVMVLARSSSARAHLSQQLRQRQMTKEYRALVSPGPIADRLTITQPIGSVPHPTLGTVYAAHPQGKEAHTEGWVLCRRPEGTLMRLQIPTGRPHQIRIHLASVGYPLVGDPLYGVGGVPLVREDGSVAVPGDCGYWLHAHRVCFRHPRSGEWQTWEAPLPTILTP